MLVLARKSLESVIVGNSNGGHSLIKVTVLGIRGARVTLGFDVADEVPIHRAEVWERIHTAGQPSGPTIVPVTPTL